MNKNTNNILFYLGILFLIIGGIGLTFMAFFAIIGLPIFIIGIILVLLSKRAIKTKLIWIFSVVGLVILFWPIWTKINTTESETFLIPEEYSGKITIVYGEDCGIEPPMENGRRILKIPANGILIIKPEFEGGIIDHEYFFVDDAGRKTLIERFENFSNGMKIIPGIGLGRSGNVAGKMPDGSSSSKSPLSIHFTEFEVIQDTMDKYDFIKERRFDSLFKRLVKECREKNGTQHKLL